MHFLKYIRNRKFVVVGCLFCFFVVFFFVCFFFLFVFCFCFVFCFFLYVVFFFFLLFFVFCFCCCCFFCFFSERSKFISLTNTKSGIFNRVYATRETTAFGVHSVK